LTWAGEISEILGGIKHLMETGRDWGLEAPRLSAQTLRYLEKGPATSLETLEELREHIGDCRRCKLCQDRTNLVFGEGSPQAGLVFVGEGPGREEDLVGRPFVGEAGGLLTDIIEKGMKLKRQDVYICNVVKCRPPQNRDPEADEIESCLPFLRKQIGLIRPQVICSLGRVAAKALLGRDFKVTRERGKWFSFMHIPLMPTYHPAYVIRNSPQEQRRLKRDVWKDIQEVMKKMGLS